MAPPPSSTTTGADGSKPRLAWTKTRMVLAIVLALAFAGSFGWIIFRWPLQFLPWIALAIVSGGSVAAFARLVWPMETLGRSLGIGAGWTALLSALLAVPAILDSNDATSGPPRATPTAVSASTTPPQTPSPSRTPSAPTAVLFDDFNSGLDDSKWDLTASGKSDPGELPNQVLVKGDKLHLIVSKENSAAGVKATLAPKLPTDRTITKISMKMALASQEGPSDGAAYLVILTEEGNKHRLWMGPDVNGDPALGYYICDKGSCEDRDVDDLRQYEDLPERREFTVQAVVTEKAGLQFTVIGHSSETAREDPGPITSFEFELLSNPTKGNFDVTVDDILITYAE